MKTRNGFVSNSSSSSFIVAFPSKPKSVEEVKKLLFGDAEELSAYSGPISTLTMANIVFNELKEKSATIESIAEELASGWRYHYDTNGINRLKPDIDFSNLTEEQKSDIANIFENVDFVEQGEKYFGNGKDELEALKQFTIKCELKKQNIEALQNKLIEAADILLPRTMDPNVRQEYRRKRNEFTKNSKEWQKLEKERWKVINESYGNEKCKLIKAAAMKDAQKFMDDNPGAFISHFSYSDDDGSIGSTMEHDGIFNNLNHIQNSHH